MCRLAMQTNLSMTYSLINIDNGQVLSGVAAVLSNRIIIVKAK